MQIQKDFESIARCNIINIIIAQWAKLRKKSVTFLSLFIFTTFSVHTFTWCGKSLLGITKVTRNIRLIHIHYAIVGAFTTYRIGMTHLMMSSRSYQTSLNQLYQGYCHSQIKPVLPPFFRSYLFLKYLMYSSFL